MTHTRMVKLASVAAVALGLMACFANKPTGPRNIAGAELEGKPVDINLAAAGLQVWRDKGCYACHGFGRQLGAPDLAGVMERRDHDWLRKWLKQTEVMIQSDPQ